MVLGEEESVLISLFQGFKKYMVLGEEEGRPYRGVPPQTNALCCGEGQGASLSSRYPHLGVLSIADVVLTQHPIANYTILTNYVVE